MNTALLRIMYAPLDYIHPAYLVRPAGSLSPAVQLALNHLLIQRFSLITESDQLLPLNDLSAQVVSAWALLPQVAWLIGCKLARGTLAMNGQLASLSPLARQFIALPVSCPGIELSLPWSKENVTMHGAAAVLAQTWPMALQQRLKLLFDPQTPAQLVGGTINRSLLSFAFDYAQNLTH